jgi:hypothetical protein
MGTAERIELEETLSAWVCVAVRFGIARPSNTCFSKTRSIQESPIGRESCEITETDADKNQGRFRKKAARRAYPPSGYVTGFLAWVHLV